MDTRDDLVSAALRQFADRGFYGASIAGIADELGVTKQALLHHFGTKERLYGEVLQRIADHLAATLRDAMARGGEPAQQLEALLLALLADTGGDAGRLIMRELLDNRRRAERADRWYLKPFLEALTAALREVPGWRGVSDGEAFAALYQLLGAVSYYAVSGPTLARILGKRGFAEVRAAFPARLAALVRLTLENPPPC
jgi:AcrR family transcriptional regulator